MKLLLAVCLSFAFACSSSDSDSSDADCGFDVEVVDANGDRVGEVSCGGDLPSECVDGELSCFDDSPCEQALAARCPSGTEISACITSKSALFNSGIQCKPREA